MNNNDLNDMVKKAQEMINNNQVPDEIKDLASKIGNNSASSNSSDSDSANGLNNSSSSNVSSESFDNNSNDSSINSGNGSSGSSQFDFSNIDIGTLMKVQSMISKLNSASDDDMSKLLFALKPYLRNEKKEKVDEYIKLVRMGKMTELFNLLGK